MFFLKKFAFVYKYFILVSFQVEIDENSLGEQTLPNFYAEDINNCMNRERRREALAKFLRIIKADVDRETKGKYLFVYFVILNFI